MLGGVSVSLEPEDPAHHAPRGSLESAAQVARNYQLDPRISATVPAFAAVDQRAIKQRLRDAKRRAVLARDQAHGSIAIARKSRLKKRRIKTRNRGGNPRIQLIIARN